MFSNSLRFAVSALLAVRNSLIDPFRQLRNWDKGDPCTSNWTGVVCYDTIGTDSYWHVDELYDPFPVLYSFPLMFAQ